MKRSVLMTALMLGSLALTSMGCASSRPRPDRVVVVHDVAGPGKVVVVKKKPPARRREVRPHRPSQRHVWVPGHWDWRGHRYVWVSGHWAVPPRHGATWVAGHWEARHGGWVFVAGYWR